MMSRSKTTVTGRTGSSTCGSLTRSPAGRGLRIGIVAVALASWGAAVSAQTVAPGRVEFMQKFKSFLYKSVTLANADAVAAGTGDPFVYVETGVGNLPVSFYHFPIRTDRLPDFVAALDLPSWLTPVPVSIVRGTPPRHYITVSVHAAGGERAGLRAEWYSYVRGPGDERPRLLMLDAAMDRASLDPVRIHAPPAQRFVYNRTGRTLTTDVVSGDSVFASSIPLPALPVKAQILDRHWGAAGDVVYWRNGVADLQNFNGLIANRRVLSIPPESVTLDNRSPWAAFATERPEWVVLADERIDVSLRPWVNADDPAVPLDPAFRNELLQTKATVYPALERERAAGIAGRRAEPMADFLLEASPPAIFLNYRIRPERREALAAAIPLPAGFRLAPVQPVGSVAKDYYLSLNIYMAAGLAPGLRAEWSVYVTKDGDPNPRFMIVDVRTSIVSIDPLNVITIPADVFTYTSSGNALGIDLRAPDLSFQASLWVPGKPERREMNLDWAECNNLVYWRNGVADKIYYNEAAYGPVALVPTRNVVLKDGTRWAGYVDLDHVFVYEEPQGFVASPWNNLNALQASPVAPPSRERTAIPATGVRATGSRR